jgi:hypothetical protein
MRLRSLVAAIVAPLALLVMSGPSFACKCAVVPRDQAIGSVPVVFEGRIVNIETSGTAQVTTLTVVRSVKGATAGATLKVKSHTVSASCGYDFRKLEQTLVVGGRGAGRGMLDVHRCTMFNLNP